MAEERKRLNDREKRDPAIAGEREVLHGKRKIETIWLENKRFCMAE